MFAISVLVRLLQVISSFPVIVISGLLKSDSTSTLAVPSHPVTVSVAVNVYVPAPDTVISSVISSSLVQAYVYELAPVTVASIFTFTSHHPHNNCAGSAIDTSMVDVFCVTI